uniref:Cathepsin L1-like n=1 Tax=Varanus komodoensis TaxID=61221 RepID=A0A8D2LST6_VARKO
MPPRFVVVIASLLWMGALSCALDLALEGAWKGWKELHGKAYQEEEEAFRRAVWEKNLHRVHQHNVEASLGKHTFQLAMNHLGDLVTDSGQGTREPRSHRSTQMGTFPGSSSRALFTFLGFQGRCGACWAFSATGALEGLLFNQTGKLVPLSEQNLIDCSQKLGNHGCHGGYITRAFQYVRDNGGLNSEQDYPYVGMPACHYNPQNRMANCSSLVMLPQGSEVALEQAVATVGPVSVAVDAKNFPFHFYKSGIFSSSWCSHLVNHAMLLVGYGSSQEYGTSTDYWILKNSWSEYWGEKGYMRLVKGAGNHCGVANQASYPTR